MNNSQHGADPPQKNDYGSLQVIGILGTRTKSSKSLQSLGISTRQVEDRTTNMEENMKHKYGSRMDMNSGKYDKFTDDPDSLSVGSEANDPR